MNLPELRLLAIAGPPVLQLDTVVAACRAAVDGGVTGVQLRVKSLAAGPLTELTRALCAALPVPVYVNDRADVALAAGAAGVHVGTDDLPPAAVRQVAGDALRIGVSIGTDAEADAALRSDVDYWSIGCIYHTGTKPDAGMPIGVTGFRSLRERAPAGLPVIAIGGIGVDNAAEVLNAGAQGVAVSHAVFGVRDVRRAAAELRDAIDAALSH